MWIEVKVIFAVVKQLKQLQTKPRKKKNPEASTRFCSGLSLQLLLKVASQLTAKITFTSKQLIQETRRILDVLYSAQRGNQHKDAFA